MEVIKAKATTKRYRISFSSILQLWICDDLKYQVVGFGDTPYSAFQDCCIELEIATSDLHK